MTLSNDVLVDIAIATIALNWVLASDCDLLIVINLLLILVTASLNSTNDEMALAVINPAKAVFKFNAVLPNPLNEFCNFRWMAVATDGICYPRMIGLVIHGD